MYSLSKKITESQRFVHFCARELKLAATILASESEYFRQI
jgi:hypothetical protein